MLEDISVPRNDSLEVPPQHVLQRMPEGRAIRHQLARDPARPEALPRAVRPEEQASGPGWRALNVEAQIGEHQAPRRSVEEKHLVEAKTEHEMALDSTGPRGGGLICEGRLKGERLAPPRSAWSSQELSGRVAPGSLAGEPSVRPWNDDEADRTEGIDLLSKFRRDGDRRMENESPVAEPDDGHADGDRNQAGLPAELVFGAPKIRIVPNQRQWSAPRPRERHPGSGAGRCAGELEVVDSELVEESAAGPLRNAVHRGDRSACPHAQSEAGSGGHRQAPAAAAGVPWWNRSCQRPERRTQTELRQE